MIQVMKFGGTSLNTQEHRLYAINKIKAEIDKGNKVVVVVSAMGRKNEPYSTNTLLDFGHNLSLVQKDRLISYGELMSSLVFENECRQMNIIAHACTPSEIGIYSDDNYGAANVIELNPSWILYYLRYTDIVIVPGFIALSMSGHITTLGRGGSDKTAILLADCLGVNDVQIFTDVDGIYDSDPKLNVNAIKYKTLSFDKCLKLVNDGACVMMKESVEFAKEKNISFSVASTFFKTIGTKVGGI